MKKTCQKYISYLSPEFIYIPFDKVENLKLNKNKMVLNNLCVGTDSEGNNIFSPVSGKILGQKNMILNGNVTNTLVIANDFMDRREKLNPLRDMKKLKKADIVASLEKYGLHKKVNSKTTMVVKCEYDKKYDLKDMVINYESYEQILEAIDEFMDIFGMKKCYISVDSSDLFSINAYEKYINAFLNIALISNKKKLKADTYVTYNVEEILAIHKAIHLDYMYDNTIITINNGKPTIVKVKLYSSLAELLRVLKINTKGKRIFINNKAVSDIKDYIIDSSVRSVIIKD